MPVTFPVYACEAVRMSVLESNQLHQVHIPVGQKPCRFSIIPQAAFPAFCNALRIRNTS